MEYTIRELKNEDIEKLSLIMQKAFLNKPWQEQWEKEVCYKRITLFNQIPFAYNLVLIDENENICGASIGYIIPFEKEISFELQEFFVNPNIKNQHLGTKLMNLLLNKLKEKGITKVKFYTSGELYKFYSKFGFKKVEEEYLMEIKL